MAMLARRRVRARAWSTQGTAAGRLLRQRKRVDQVSGKKLCQLRRYGITDHARNRLDLVVREKDVIVRKRLQHSGLPERDPPHLPHIIVTKTPVRNAVTLRRDRRRWEVGPHTGIH